MISKSQTKSVQVLFLVGSLLIHQVAFAKGVGSAPVSKSVSHAAASAHVATSAPANSQQHATTVVASGASAPVSAGHFIQDRGGRKFVPETKMKKTNPLISVNPVLANYVSGARFTQAQLTAISQNPMATPDLAVQALVQIQQSQQLNPGENKLKGQTYTDSELAKLSATMLSKLSPDEQLYTITTAYTVIVAAAVATNNLAAADQAAKAGLNYANQALANKDINMGNGYSASDMAMLKAAQKSFVDFSTQNVDADSVAAIAMKTGVVPVIYQMPVDENTKLSFSNIAGTIVYKDADGKLNWTNVDGLAAKVKEASAEVVQICKGCIDTGAKNLNNSSSSSVIPAAKTYSESDGKGGVVSVNTATYENTTTQSSWSYSVPSSGGTTNNSDSGSDSP